jgi:serralysin
MVTITATADVALDMFETGIGSALSQTITFVQSNRIEVSRGDNYSEILEGSGLASTTEGTVNRVTEITNGVKAFVIDGMATSVADILAWGDQQDYQAFFEHILVGNDLIIASSLDDRIFSYGGNDVIKAGGGDDQIDAGSGYNIIDGGAGNDTVFLAGNITDYTILQNGYTYILTSSTDNLKISSIESFYFADGGSLEVNQLTSTIKAFDALNYVASYEDLRRAFGANVDAASSHYAYYGFDEGRDPNAFNALEYIAAYSDLRAAFGINTDAATRHYVSYGADENRTARFSGMAYLASYSDLRAVFGDDVKAATKHYILYGAKEGRTLTFDAAEYLASNPSLIGSLGNDLGAATEHFVTTGAAKGMSVDSFNALAYIASYSDLISAFGINASAGRDHFLIAGAAEGRHVTFDALAYAHAYSDLEAAFGDNQLLLIQHYILYGSHEGRTVPSIPEPFS